MSLLSLVITLIVVGVLLWLVNTHIPMDGKIRRIINIVVVIVVVLWLLLPPSGLSGVSRTCRFHGSSGGRHSESLEAVAPRHRPSRPPAWPSGAATRKTLCRHITRA